MNHIDSLPRSAIYIAVNPVVTNYFFIWELWAQIKTLLNSEMIRYVSIQIFLDRLRKENQKNNLVAILFIKNKFYSLFFIKKKSNHPAALYKRWLMFNFQRCLLNTAMIFITDEFLRTWNSFCSCEAACYAKLSRKKEYIFLPDLGKLTLTWTRFFQGCFWFQHS